MNQEKIIYIEDCDVHNPPPEVFYLRDSTHSFTWGWGNDPSNLYWDFAIIDLTTHTVYLADEIRDYTTDDDNYYADKPKFYVKEDDPSGEFFYGVRV